MKHVPIAEKHFRGAKGNVVQSSLDDLNMTIFLKPLPLLDYLFVLQVVGIKSNIILI